MDNHYENAFEESAQQTQQPEVGCRLIHTLSRLSRSLCRFRKSAERTAFGGRC